MRTLFIRLFLATILLMCSVIVSAQQIVIYVDAAGTLSSKIASSKKYLITELKIIGTINGTDVNYIREMAGVDYDGNVTEGQLINLDLSGVNIVKGGNPYYHFSSFDKFYTSDNEIGNYMFQSTKLQTIILPSSITSIREGSFSNSKGLTSIDIPNSVANLDSYVFSGCEGLTAINIPNTVTKIVYHVFDKCASLTSINVEEGNLNYSSKDGILYNKSKSQLLTCPGGLKGAITIPNTVNNIASFAFSGCKGLTSINIPNTVTDIAQSAFYQCSGLTSIIIPESITSIGDYLFEYCSGLTSITIPNTITTIGSGAFTGCSGLTSMTIPNTIINLGSGAFTECRGLTSVNLPSTLTVIESFLFYKCSSLTSITIPSTVTKIGNYSFYGCTGLTSINIPTTVKSIEDYAFYGCSGLTTITLPKAVNLIGSYTFSGCSNIQSIYSHNEVPPEYYSSFDASVQQNATLYVPKGSYSSYWVVPGWGDFVNIKEMDDTMSGVNNITDNNSDSSTYFSIDGKHYVNPQKGLNIIKNSNGSTKKVIVR